jgi:potassium-transporting ATPase KdpC subunit
MHFTWYKRYKGWVIMKNIFKELRIGLISTLVLAVIVCGIYPLMVWGIAQGLFPQKANGSLIMHGGKVIGSNLLSQGFTGTQYFHPRPSAAGKGYDAASSAGSNQGPLSQKLMDTVRQRVSDYRTENNLPRGSLVPADAVTASASGLDPHISLENALVQLRRIAKARGMSEEALHKKIAAHTEARDLGFLGESRVNVLLLNLDLDGDKK